jgi:hypothetical protein
MKLLPGRPPDETSSAELLTYIYDSKKERTKRTDIRTNANVVDVLKLAEQEGLDAVNDITIKQLASDEERINRVRA